MFKTNRTGFARRGSALILALVLIIVLVGYAGSLLAIGLANSRNAECAVGNTQALYISEGGVNAALAELETGVDVDADGLGTIARNYPNAWNGESRYRVLVTPLADGTLRVVAVGTVPNASRAIEAVVRCVVPFPGQGAALGLYGMCGSKTRFQLLPAQGSGDGGETGSDRNLVRIDGRPADGSKAIPAVAIQDPRAYATVMDAVAQQAATGRLDPAWFAGEPVVDYTSSTGNSVSVPIVEVPDPRLNPGLLSELRNDIIDRVGSTLLPEATQTVARDGARISGAETWGTPTAPTVTVIDAKDLSLEKGAVVKGHGILVVRGGLRLKKDSELDWTGTIVVIGTDGRGGDGTKLVVEGGTLNVTGNVLVLGTDASSAEFRVANDSNNRQGVAQITGALLALSGADCKTSTQVASEQGNLQVDGFVGVFGAWAELHVEEMHANSTAFSVNGSAVVAVPPEGDDSGGDRLAVKLHGNTSIHYDPAKEIAAMDGLLTFLNRLKVPPTWRIVSWREVSAVAADAVVKAGAP